ERSNRRPWIRRLPPETSDVHMHTNAAATDGNQNPPDNPIPPKPTALPVLFGNIPPELRKLSRWVLWRYGWRKRKWTKPPCPISGSLASPADPATWASLEEVKVAYLATRGKEDGWDGVGFVHLPEDELTGIDLDKCRDKVAGAIQPWAAAIVTRLNTY